MNMKNSRIIIPAFAVLLLCAAVVSVVHFSSSAAPFAAYAGAHNVQNNITVHSKTAVNLLIIDLPFI